MGVTGVFLPNKGFGKVFADTRPNPRIRGQGTPLKFRENQLSVL